jgi:uncharacterized protein YbcI
VTSIEQTGRSQEGRLREDGIVTSLRHKFQATMRDDLVGGVELLTGRRIVSFLSDHDPHADCAVEVFVLDAPPEAPAEDG